MVGTGRVVVLKLELVKIIGVEKWKSSWNKVWGEGNELCEAGGI